jgi:hypothetical protein
LRPHGGRCQERQRRRRAGKSITQTMEVLIMATKPGLYANINAKRERIKEGSGEKMRKPGSPGAPTKKDFVQSAKTAKKPMKGK